MLCSQMQVDSFSYPINLWISRVLYKITNHYSPHHKVMAVAYPKRHTQMVPL